VKKESLKQMLYEQVARIGKALASPKRLELIELLAQGEKSVDLLARQAGIDMRLASAHLRVLREARLVETRRDGKFVHYRLSGRDVASFQVRMRELAEAHLAELGAAIGRMMAAPETLSPEDRESLLARARRGEVIVIDVRPGDEYLAGHLPCARSMPLDELQQRMAELPPGSQVVAYCRGPFCMMSDAAVGLLRRHGFAAHKMIDGIAEWRAHGLPVEC